MSESLIPQAETHYSAEDSLGKERQLPPELAGQMDQFFVPLLAANELRYREDRRNPEEYESLRAYYSEYVLDHNMRAEEIATPEYQEVVKLAVAQFKNPVFGIDCMDGRNEPAVQHGFSAKIFARFRTAGASISEIVRGTDQKMKLIKGKFTNVLDAAYEKNDITNQRFDSHVGCAARKHTELLKKGGDAPADSGLYRDVMAKMRMADAVEAYIVENHPDKKVNSILESFDPHTGYLFLGLDTRSARRGALSIAKNKAIELGKDPEKAEPEYTEEVLGALALEGKILSTIHMVQEPDIRSVLDEHYFAIDWQNDYVGSAKKYWENIALTKTDSRTGEETPALKDVLLPVIFERLISMYPKLNPNSEEDNENLLHDQAMLVLTNLYSGYLHNPNAQHGVNDSSQNGHSHGGVYSDYKYNRGAHQESGLDNTDGAYGPYPTVSTLEVSSHDPNPAEQIVLGTGIVRANRHSMRIFDHSGNITGSDEFTAVSVPMTVTEIIRNEEASSYGAIAAKVDWSDMPSNWDTLSHEEFDAYLDKKSQSIQGGIPHTLAKSIKTLRVRTANLYRDMGSLLIDHDNVAMPILSGPNREILGIVPFVKVGY